jgi:hypothetical protein
MNMLRMSAISEFISPDALRRRNIQQFNVSQNLTCIAGAQHQGKLSARCYVCGLVDLSFSPETDKSFINWREALVCPICGLNNRMRAAVTILDVYCNIDRLSPTYITEQTTRAYTLLQSKLYPHLIGSEFLGDDIQPVQSIICSHLNITKTLLIPQRGFCVTRYLVGIFSISFAASDSQMSM